MVMMVEADHETRVADDGEMVVGAPLKVEDVH